MKTRYVIIHSRKIDKLVTLINEFIDREGEAWRPVGNMGIDTCGPFLLRYFQAMYRGY